MCIYSIYNFSLRFQKYFISVSSQCNISKVFWISLSCTKIYLFELLYFSIVNEIWFTWPVVCLTTQAQAPRVFDMFDIFLKDSKLDLKEDTPTNPICTVGVSNVWWVWLHIMWVWLSPQWVFQMCGGCGYT